MASTWLTMDIEKLDTLTEEDKTADNIPTRLAVQEVHQSSETARTSPCRPLPRGRT